MPSTSRIHPLWAFAIGVGVTSLGVIGWLRFTPPPADPTPLRPPNAMALEQFVEDGIWREIAAGNDAIMHAPTPPPRDPRLALPWAKHRAIILAVRLDEVTRNPARARLYAEVLKAALPVTRVTVLFHRRDRRLTSVWLSQLEALPEIAPLLDKIEFVPAEIDSMWVRDFGPFFGVDRSGHLLVYDTAYLDPRIELSNYLTTEGQAHGQLQTAERASLAASIESIRGTDISPSIYAAYLQVEQRSPALLIRPPLILAGGDMLPVDPRTLLISQSTLEANGGRTDFLESHLRQYLGVRNVHYLAALPGETIEHLDFVAQIISDDAILVASPPDFDDHGRPALKLLKRELHQRLNGNIAYLQKNFPDHRIIPMPMPAPQFSADAEIIGNLFFDAARASARQLGLNPAVSVRQSPPQSASPVEMVPEISAHLCQLAGVTSLDSVSNRSRVISAVFQRPLSALIAEFSDTFILYRSYLNSILICGAEGERLLIPRFRPRTDFEAEQFAQLEPLVEAAYHQARPSAELIWIDCTAIVENFGALHCFITTLPDPETLGVN